jgi:hypothetical protein
LFSPKTRKARPSKLRRITVAVEDFMLPSESVLSQTVRVPAS